MIGSSCCTRMNTLVVEEPMSMPCEPTCAPSVRSSLPAARLAGLGVSLAAMAALALAMWLTPRSSGYGTHEELGMPPCSMLANTGWPCPTCGMTTSVSAAVHGRLSLAWKAQPFGLVLTGLLAGLAVAGAAQAVSGKVILMPLARLGWWWGVILGGGLVAGWGLRLLSGWAGGEYPLR